MSNHRLYADWEARGQVFISSRGIAWRDGDTPINVHSQKTVALGDYYTNEEKNQ